MAMMFFLQTIRILENKRLFLCWHFLLLHNLKQEVRTCENNQVMSLDETIKQLQL